MGTLSCLTRATVNRKIEPSKADCFPRPKPVKSGKALSFVLSTANDFSAFHRAVSEDFGPPWRGQCAGHMMALFLRLNVRSCNTAMTDLEVRALLEQHHRESYGWAL